jgi:hypothetical protein
MGQRPGMMGGREISEGMQGLAVVDPEAGAMERMLKVGGARSLVGLEFFFRQSHETRTRRVKLNKLNADGNTYKGTDVHAKVGLVCDISPEDLTVGLTSRRRGEDIIKLLRACDVNPEPFIDPLLGGSEEGDEEYRTPQSELDRIMGGGGSGRRSTSIHEMEGRFQTFRGGCQGEYGGGLEIPRRGGAPSRPVPGGPGVGLGMERGAYRGFGGRATSHMQFAPQVQHVERVARTPLLPEHQYPFGQQLPRPVTQVRTPAIPEQPYQFGQHLARPAAQRMGYGTPQPQSEHFGEEQKGIAEQVESLSRRVAMSDEQLRSTERARSGITTEMRRMQTTISPVEHPGLYAVADQYATIHDSLPSHRGRMALTGGCMQVIKNVDIKLSYIADAEWEYGRRLCAEGGEHLSDAQVLEIEAKILEFHAKQVVEAKKANDKMRIGGGSQAK